MNQIDLPARSVAHRGVPVLARFVLPLKAPAVLSPGRGAIKRHLILAYRPGWQSVEDLNTIARHAADLDPTIRTFIVPTTRPNPVTRKEAATLPSFIFSPGIMRGFRPLRGRVYQGGPMAKADEVRLMIERGLPVPRTALLTPDLKLDPAEWGEFVVIKPTDLATSSKGYGFKLMRTTRVRYLPMEAYPEDHPGRRGPMLVQQYISDNGHVSVYRALTIFGEPLYVRKHTTRRQVIDFNAPDDVIESVPVAHQSYDEDAETDHEFVEPPDVIALARAVHAAVPEIPLKGTDIIRDGATGKLYVIEINCRGNTWHFSSSFLAHRRAKTGPEIHRRLINQFDAFRTAARVLVARTNAEAV